MKTIVLFILLCCSTCLVSAKNISILTYIQTLSKIKDGGCDIFSYEGALYLICVSRVEVGNKSESACQTVGKTKAQRDILTFINGSEITSVTDLIMSEETVNALTGIEVKLKQKYVEHIKEKVDGSINQCVFLGGWYADDKSVYYYSMLKPLNK